MVLLQAMATLVLDRFLLVAAWQSTSAAACRAPTGLSQPKFDYTVLQQEAARLRSKAREPRGLSRLHALRLRL